MPAKKTNHFSLALICGLICLTALVKPTDMRNFSQVSQSLKRQPQIIVTQMTAIYELSECLEHILLCLHPCTLHPPLDCLDFLAWSSVESPQTPSFTGRYPILKMHDVASTVTLSSKSFRMEKLKKDRVKLSQKSGFI